VAVAQYTEYTNITYITIRKHKHKKYIIYTIKQKNTKHTTKAENNILRHLHYPTLADSVLDLFITVNTTYNWL
jgi:hypothetical protein